MVVYLVDRPNRRTEYDEETQSLEEDMTKAKARLRAKAKAGQKARKRVAIADRPGPKIRPGQYDPGASSIKSPGRNANTRNFAIPKRGAARSR